MATQRDSMRAPGGGGLAQVLRRPLSRRAPAMAEIVANREACYPQQTQGSGVDYGAN